LQVNNFYLHFQSYEYGSCTLVKQKEKTVKFPKKNPKKKSKGKIKKTPKKSSKFHPTNFLNLKKNKNTIKIF
jgi:hypothetical protein